MKKKIVALLLCVCLIGGLLAGCASKDDTNYCIGNWKLCDGNGADDSAVKAGSIEVLNQLGWKLEDFIVLSINYDGSVQEYFCGGLIEGVWKADSGTKSNLEFTSAKGTITATVNYKDGLLTYKAGNGETLYFEKTSRTAQKMSDQFKAAYSDQDPEKAFLNASVDATNSVKLLAKLKEVQDGTEKALDEFFTELGQYYYTLPVTDQENIKVYINEFQSKVTGE